MNKKLSFLLIGLMLTGTLVGCTVKDAQTKKEENDEPEKLTVVSGTPVYADDEQIEIGAYAGPRVLNYRFYNGAYGAYADDPEEGYKGWLTEEAFQDYLDCGFTYVMPEYDGMYDVDTDGKIRAAAYNFEDSDLYAYMEMAEKMNLPVVVGANILTTLTNSADYRLTDDVKAYLKEMAEKLSEYKMFKGYALRDEPNVEYHKSFKAIYNYMNELKPGLYQFTSFLPIHSPDPLRFSQNYSGDVEAAYTEYMTVYADAVGRFVYDSYPLKIDPTTNTTSILDSWYQNLEIVAKHAKEHNYDAGITIQSCGYGPEGGEETQEHQRIIETKADAAYQVYTSLAYGMKSLTWFTYWQHWMGSESEVFYGAMVNYPETADGEPVKTNAYYAVQAVNHEIQKFDHVFMKYDWEGTMALKPEGTEFSTPMSYIKDYKSDRIAKATAAEEAIIGCMKDKNGYDGFMVVNATDPGLNKSNRVEISFNKADKALIYVKGEEQTIDLKDGSYTFDLEAGEGVFVIPLYQAD